MTEKLTKSFIAKLSAGDKERVIFDSELPGFAVKALPSGRRVFFYQYRLGGRGGTLRRVTIGEYRDPPSVDLETVEGCRRKAAEYRVAVRQGVDPFAELAEKREAAAAAARAAAEEEANPDPKTIKDLSDEYLQRWAVKKKDGGAADKRALNRDILPAIGEKKIGDVTRRDIVKMLDAITDRGSPVSANRTLALTSRLFTFALARGLVTASPCVKIERQEEKPRDRVLSADEIPTFWSALDRSTMEPNLRELLRFILITGRRKSEALFINKREIDRKNSTWLIPASRTKNGRDFLTWLSPSAVKLLDDIGADEESGYYFTSAHFGAPFDPRSVDHACRDLFKVRERSKKRGKEAPKPPLPDTEPFTPHDLRRTAATMMREIGVSKDDVALVLGHTDPSVLGRHYDKYAGLAEKKRALALWADRLQAILEPRPSNVRALVAG